jgi:hypothetical protein
MDRLHTPLSDLRDPLGPAEASGRSRDNDHERGKMAGR